MTGDAAEADNTENRYQSYNCVMKSRRWLWIVLILLLLGGASGLAWRQLGPITIVTAHPTRGPAVRAVYATGTAEPAVMLPIAARSTGRLMELKVDEGDTVRADQVLAQLEDADLQRSVDELAARARFAKSQFERAQALFDRKLGSPLERDQANADWQAAEAALARARALQGFMILRAPAD
ncbi:MAG: biotin/lipoyl-binding protein, partial [Candidatus Competibacteraceae bacterium]